MTARDMSTVARMARIKSNTVELASTLTGQIRLLDGTLVVFVEPQTSPCPDEECGREHHWLQGAVVRRCSGQPGALILAG